jgi:hypothetical protein
MELVLSSFRGKGLEGKLHTRKNGLSHDFADRQITLFHSVHSHSPSQCLSLSAAISVSSIIRELPQDYNNYFRLSVGKTVPMVTRCKLPFRKFCGGITPFICLGLYEAEGDVLPGVH